MSHPKSKNQQKPYTLYPFSIQLFVAPFSVMASNQYHFITNWTVEASSAEVYDILSDAEGLKRWWPSVYLDTKIIKPGDSRNVGKEVSLYTKGWLPYTLRWTFIVTEASRPFGFTIKAQGDFDGRGIWKFQQDGSRCRITFDWQLNAEKPLLKAFSFLLRPAFSANHRWAMKRGLQSLQLELLRKRGEVNVPAPPKPVFPHNLTNNHVL